MTKLIYNTAGLVFLFSVFVFPNSAFATDGVLYLSPERGVYAINEKFSVKVLLDSDGEEINAAEAELSFNPDELLVEDISTEKSIFNMWTLEPEFSNETGTIEFAGGTRNNYVGDSGLLITITFRALRNITSRANLTAGAILAADGIASNIITSMRSGVYTLKPKEIIPASEYAITDTEPPEYFKITEQDYSDSNEPRAKFLFDAFDKEPGIEGYEIQIDGGDAEIWNDGDGDHVYTTPFLSYGKHTILVKAFDGAGNYLMDSVSFVIKSDQLSPPILVTYPEVLNKSEFLIIKGKFVPDSDVFVWLQKNGEPAKRHQVSSDKNGDFTFIAEEKQEEGVYVLWAEVFDEGNVNSVVSQKITFAVEPPEIIQLASLAVSFLSILVPLVALLALLGILAGFIWYRVGKLKNKLKKRA